MKITKKLIKENQDKKFKELFPDVFKVELEVGKWYNHSAGGFWYIDSEVDNNKNAHVYGFAKNGRYFFREKLNTSYLGSIATPEEVQQALEKEAVRRGLYSDKKTHYYYIDGAAMLINPKKDKIIFKDGVLYLWNIPLFKDGVWAEIIPTITKQEAEEKLKCKIVD